MSTIPYERLKLYLDMDYIFLRMERNLRHGIARERVMSWVREAVAAEIPPQTRWMHPDGGTFTGTQFHVAVLHHCERWADYLQHSPPAPEPGDDTLLLTKLGQLRMKI